MMALWDQLCQSFGMPALLFFAILSAGEKGLADRLVHLGFLLRTVGMVIFLARLGKRTPRWRPNDCNSEVVLAWRLIKARVLADLDIKSILRSDGALGIIHSVNFQRHTFLLWLLVCVSRSGLNGSSVQGRSIWYFFWAIKLICFLCFWGEMNRAWGFIFSWRVIYTESLI